MNILEARRRLLEGGIKKRTAAGNPIVVRSLARMYPGLNIYGWSKQDGTPSPENPVPIVSAGDNGEINVSVSDGGTQSQTLTISTPGGLPGIPVDSGGNYTDENGQQWVCDEIDLARGKYVQRTDEVVLSSTNISLEYAKQDTNLFSIPTVKLLSPASNVSTLGGNFILSNIQPPSENDVYSSNIPGVGYTNESSYLRINISNSGVGESLDTFKDFLDDMEQEGNPAKILYIIATPIETDLPAEEISAYKALHTYSPATTVSNDAEAWMKLTYKTRKSLEVTT